jgi:hypothetical protein
MYGVVSADHAISVAEWTGIDAGLVYYVSEGALAAVVSDVPNGRLRPQRRHLAAHQAVLKRLMQESAVLPMSFGTIADNPEKVRQVLALNQDALLDQLRRVAGKGEMSLRVRWDVPNIFEYFVNTHSQLSALRDQLFRGGREPSQTDKIELGRLFQGILNADRAAHTETVWRALLPCCAEIKETPPREDREVMNLVCLVERDLQKEFENAVLEAANLFDDTFCFDFSGPWPPYNFVDVQLSM